MLNMGSFDGGFINGIGDAVFLDGKNNTLYFAYDLTTASLPEPPGPIFVGTGLLWFLLAARLKMIGQPGS